MGNSRIIGQASNDLVKDGDSGKLNQTKRYFAQGPANKDHWIAHLEGKISLGLVPITDYQECKFMAIDVDLHVMEEVKVTLTSLCAQIEAAGIPGIVCRSKSGAAHIYFFFKDLVKVSSVRKTMIRIADFLGFTALDKPCEFFPHTNSLDSDSNGKYINLPYFASDDTNRYALSHAGSRLNLDAFVALAESKQVSAKQFNDWKGNVKEQESIRDMVVNGPPCLQTIYEQKIETGSRNDMLFQFAILFKKADKKNFENLTEQVNLNNCHEPIASSELGTVIKGMRRKDYHYNCAHPCMSPICARQLCQTRKYGIKAQVEFPAIKEIIQWGQGDDYFEIIFESGAKVKMLSAELLDFHRTQAVILQALNIVLPTPKKHDWQEFVTAITEKIRRVDVPKEFNVEASIKSLILAYATSRTIGDKIEDLMAKKPVRENGMILIRHKDLQEEINKRRFLGYIDMMELSVVINDLKGQFTVIDVGHEKTAIFKIPDPKIDQNEILDKIATDFQPKY